MGSARAKLTVLLASGMAAMFALTVPAAADTSVLPTFRAEDNYFHCTGQFKVENLNNAADDTTPATWNTTKPTKSVTDGEGCGALDVAAVREAGNVDAYFSGTFTGNIRDLTIHLYSFILSQARAPSTPLTVKVARLDVDGETYVTNTAVNVTPTITNMGATESVDLSVTGLGFANPIYDANGNLVDVEKGGLATEDGDGTTQHQIVFYIDSDPNQTNTFWVWDTSEVPAGITFNPGQLAAAKIPATLPGG